MKKVLLDAGHYGKYNRSTTNKAYYESDMAWKLHKLIGAYLLENYSDVQVDYTRKTQGKDLAVYNRGTLAKGYDMFASIHSNASATEKTDYPIVITLLNASNATKSACLNLANEIAKAMGCKNNGKIGTRAGSSGGEYYGVLRGARAVGCKIATIVEHGFHTNSANTEWLLKDSNLEKLARIDGDNIAAMIGLKKKKQEPTAPTPSTNTGFKVKVIVDGLNVRKGPSTKYDVSMTIRDKGTYTISETDGSWGKLKSGAGWINISEKYVKKV